ncbi:hypothetical protein CW304_00685 [Bacillus sp. UFRGS-B20]|nr:hypothetical protein CW304_00685 [Bacillus sp. UFRGS-B20]
MCLPTKCCHTSQINCSEIIDRRFLLYLLAPSTLNLNPFLTFRSQRKLCQSIKKTCFFANQFRYNLFSFTSSQISLFGEIATTIALLNWFY